MAEIEAPPVKDKNQAAILWIAGCLILALLLIVIEVSHHREHITVGNLDYFGIVKRARRLPGDPDAWVRGLRPVGIPLLIKLGLAAGLDVVRAGQVISITGGILCLWGVGLLARAVTRSRAMGLLAMAYLLTMSAILFYAGFEGTDMLAAGLHVLGLGLLARAPRDRRWVLLSGLTHGLGYLIRYTGLIVIVADMLYLLLVAAHRRSAEDLWLIPIHGLGFVLGALLQLVPSLIFKGDPLYQTQAYHVWLKLYADSDFVRAIQQETPEEITLWQLFWLGPRRFIENWWSEFSRFWMRGEPSLLDQPLAQLSTAGFLFTTLDRRNLALKHRLLIAISVVGVVGGLSIFDLDARFLILLIPVQLIGALYFLWRILPARVDLGRLKLPLNWLVLLALLAANLSTPLRFARSKEGGPHAQVIATSNMMQAAGAQSASEILSTNLYHQDVSAPTRDRFRMLYLLDTPPTPEELREYAREHGYRFLIYDTPLGPQYHPQYEALLWPQNRPEGYTPIWAAPAWEGEDRFAAYRLEPEEPAPTVPKDIALAGGVSLTGYDLTVSPKQPLGTGHLVGLYLYWSTSRPLTASLKVFVHLFDAQNNLVAQHDSVPALWTQNTQTWEPGAVVIDFHALDIPPSALADDLSLVVGLYDEGSGTRWPVLHEGQPDADAIPLTQIHLSEQTD